MTVVYVEGHILEVCIIIAELIGGQAHRISTHIGSCSHVRASEHHLRCVIQCAAACQVIARHALCSTIICYSILVARYGNGQGGWRNHLVAVGHLEYHVGKVATVIVKLTCVKIHIGGTHIRSCRLLSTIKGEVSGSIQRIANLHLITANTMFCAIVNHGILMTRDGHHYSVYRSNMIITICYIEGYRSEVAIDIGELVSGQAHVACSHIGTFSGDNTTNQNCGIGRCEGKVGNRVQRILDFHIIAAHAVFSSIVNGSVMMTGDGHGHVDRGDTEDTRFSSHRVVRVHSSFGCHRDGVVVHILSGNTT